MNDLQTEIAGKSANLEIFVDKIARQPGLLPEIFDGLRADRARIKFGCLKVLRLISEHKPAVLYPEIVRLFDLLDNENNILR